MLWRCEDLPRLLEEGGLFVDMGCATLKASLGLPYLFRFSSDKVSLFLHHLLTLFLLFYVFWRVGEGQSTFLMFRSATSYNVDA